MRRLIVAAASASALLVSPTALAVEEAVTAGVHANEHGVCADWWGPESVDDDPNMVGARDNDVPSPLGLPGGYVSADGGHSCEGWLD